MTILLGQLELTRRSTNASAAPHLSEIEAAARTVARAAKDLLSLIPNEAIPMQAEDLNDLVRALRPRIEAETRGQIESQFVFAPTAPRAVVNADLLGRMIIELVRNAVAAGARHVRIEVAPYESQSDSSFGFERVDLRVLDDGPGFPTEVALQVDRGFHRIEQRNGKSGFGLAWVSVSAQRQRGTLSIGTGKGGRAVIRFPRVASRRDERSAES